MAQFRASSRRSGDRHKRARKPKTRWLWRQSSANLSLFRFPCCAGKYREILALEAGYGEAALALANKFKLFPSDSLHLEQGISLSEQRIARSVARNFLYGGERCWREADISRCRARDRFYPFGPCAWRLAQGNEVSLERCLSPRLKTTRRGDIVFGRSGGVGAWRKLRTWRRSGRCISVLRWRYQYVHDEARVGR